MRPLRFFLDFDGTIATADVVDLVLERFAPPAWQLVEKEWASGKIGSRECLGRQLALVNAPQPELEALIDTVTIDPGFVSFLKAAAEVSVPVAVVSDGFEPFIRRILARHVDAAILEKLPIFSNRFDVDGGKLKAVFAGETPCEHGCANCKPAVLGREKKADDFVIFVGDGLSDRFAARVSDLTFAKGKLLEFCQQNRLKHRPYEGFREIEGWLRECHASRLVIQSLHHSN